MPFGPLFVRLQRYLVAGILTAIPIWITWVVFQFVGKRLVELGRPWQRALSKTLSPYINDAPAIVLHPWFDAALAMALTVGGLCLLGWVATQVVGRRLIGLVERMIGQIPFVQTVYGASKKLIEALQTRPAGTNRVVLIEFPNDKMKTIGLVTRVLTDSGTGQKLAAVYVPTTPNPTSGYLEIIPVERLVELDWSMDEAVSFIISGGAVAPESIRYSGSGKAVVTPAGATPGKGHPEEIADGDRVESQGTSE